jgi:hypothetical protein
VNRAWPKFQTVLTASQTSQFNLVLWNILWYVFWVTVLSADERRSVFREWEVIADRIVPRPRRLFTNTIMTTTNCWMTRDAWHRKRPPKWPPALHVRLWHQVMFNNKHSFRSWNIRVCASVVPTPLAQQPKFQGHEHSTVFRAVCHCSYKSSQTHVFCNSEREPIIFQQVARLLSRLCYLK